MRRILQPIAIVLLSTSGAAANCPSYPDTLATGFVENRTAHAICMQRELGRRVDEAAEQARIDAAIGQIAIELEQQRQRMLATSGLPPAWP